MKYFVNLNPKSEEYLYILWQSEETGPIIDELGRCTAESKLSELTEITEARYDLLAQRHEDGNMEDFEDYVHKVIAENNELGSV